MSDLIGRKPKKTICKKDVKRAMGRIEEMDGRRVYRQDDGEITADLTRFEEKLAVEHHGSPLYQRVFFLLVALGVLYLGWLLIRFH